MQSGVSSLTRAERRKSRLSFRLGVRPSVRSSIVHTFSAVSLIAPLDHLAFNPLSAVLEARQRIKLPLVQKVNGRCEKEAMKWPQLHNFLSLYIHLSVYPYIEQNTETPESRINIHIRAIYLHSGRHTMRRNVQKQQALLQQQCLSLAIVTRLPYCECGRPIPCPQVWVKNGPLFPFTGQQQNTISKRAREKETTNGK